MIGKAAMPTPGLSFCMMVKDEERDLATCLDSVRDLAGELIVVDTGSTDRTRDIAAEYGAEVMPFDFTIVDFAAARNHAIGRAKRRWILMLDADETLDRASAPMVEKIVAEDQNAGFFLERYNHSAAQENPFTDYVVRLFPNRPDYRYRGRVHETVDASILAGGGKLIQSAVRIDHRFAADRDARRRKNYRYIEILREEIAADFARSVPRSSRRRPNSAGVGPFSLVAPLPPRSGKILVRSATVNVASCSFLSRI